MTQSEQAKFAVSCQHASRMIEEFEGAVFSWASRRIHIDKEFNRYYRKLYKYVEKMPEEWVGMATAQCAVALVFGDPSRLKKCLAAIRDQLSDATCEFIASFVERPWRFCFFTIADRLGHDFYTIHDHFGGQDLLLQSKSVTTLLRENMHRFFALVFQTDSQPDSCWQTYGSVMPLQCFSPQDLDYFAQCVDSSLWETHGIVAVASARPVPFVFLATYTEMPPTVHGDSEVVFSSSIIPVPDPMAIVLPEDTATEAEDNVLKFSLGGESLFDAITFYLDVDMKLAVLSTASWENYREGVAFLKPYVQFPPEPQLALGPIILMATKDILDKEYPLAYYEDLFEKKTSKTESRELQKMNSALAILSERHNRGKSIDVESFARETGLSQDVATQMMGILGAGDKKLSIPLQYGIAGFTPPAPIERRRMTGSLEFNILFGFNSGSIPSRLFDAQRQVREGLLEGYGLSTIVPLDGFPSQMDELFERFWERDDRTLLLYTLYLLRKSGDAYHTARDYASEVLRIFHQVLLSSQDQSAIDSFIRTYSRFIYQVLSPAGLVETGPVKELKEIRAGAYLMRGTEFFRAWLDWKA